MRFDRLLQPGLIDYRLAIDLQREWLDRIACGELSSALVICSHPAVITLGRSSRAGSLKVSPHCLEQEGIGMQTVRRGGDVTYHGPGQLVAYPVVDLRLFNRDLHAYLRWIEAAIIRFLGILGIPAQRRPGYTGVWLQDKKIASIGIAVNRWVAWHGAAINITGESLAGFSFIRPCGMDVAMTCAEQALGCPVDMRRAQQSLIRSMHDD